MHMCICLIPKETYTNRDVLKGCWYLRCMDIRNVFSTLHSCDIQSVRSNNINHIHTYDVHTYMHISRICIQIRAYISNINNVHTYDIHTCMHIFRICTSIHIQDVCSNMYTYSGYVHIYICMDIICMDTINIWNVCSNLNVYSRCVLDVSSNTHRYARCMPNFDTRNECVRSNLGDVENQTKT